MSGTATYNQATRIIDVAANGLPTPVTNGTFPNADNTNQVTEQDFDHDFYYRGGTFGTTRTFDDNTFSQTGFLIQVPLSVADNTLLGTSIQVGDRILFQLDPGTANERNQVFIYKGTEQTATAGEFWRATDQYLELIVDYSREHTGTYNYYDQRNARNQTPLGAVGIAANGVVFFNPSAGSNGNPPTSFTWLAPFADAHDPVDFGEDNCGGYPEITGQYHYHTSDFLSCWKDDAVMATYNDYFGASQYNGDNLRHPDGHSKMLGIAFDGFPIYGPYLYSDPWDNDSDIGRATSSYRIKSEETVNRPDYGTTAQNPPAGSLMQDWEYGEALGNMDSHNGRFCITPEYPDGTYAYFLTTTVDSEDNLVPAFPYIVGLYPRETFDQPANNGARTPQSDDGVSGGNVAPATIQITAQPQNATINSGNSVTFSVTSTIIPEDGAKGYQWYRSTDGGFSFAVLTGATNASYTFTALSYMTGYKFRCEIRGPIGDTAATNSPLQTEIATLTVTGFSGGTAENFDSTNVKLDSTTVRFDAT